MFIQNPFTTTSHLKYATNAHRKTNSVSKRAYNIITYG